MAWPVDNAEEITPNPGKVVEGIVGKDRRGRLVVREHPSSGSAAAAPMTAHIKDMRMLEYFILIRGHIESFISTFAYNSEATASFATSGSYYKRFLPYHTALRVFINAMKSLLDWWRAPITDEEKDVFKGFMNQCSYYDRNKHESKVDFIMFLERFALLVISESGEDRYNIRDTHLAVNVRELLCTWKDGCAACGPRGASFPCFPVSL